MVISEKKKNAVKVKDQTSHWAKQANRDFLPNVIFSRIVAKVKDARKLAVLLLSSRFCPF